MPAFGETIIAIVLTIINSVIDTTVRLIQLVAQLFGIVGANFHQLSALHIMIITLILGVVVFAVFKLIKGDMRHLIVGFIVLAFLLLISVIL